MWGTDAGRGGFSRSWTEEDSTWVMVPVVHMSVVPTHIPSQASVSPSRTSLWWRGRFRESMDSLALILSAADSREKAGPCRVSALASPDQGRELKDFLGERKRQTATLPQTSRLAESLPARLGRRWRHKAAVAPPSRFSPGCSAGVVISTSGSIDTACQFGALELAPGLPESATHRQWTWRETWNSFLGPRSCRSRALVLKVGHTSAGVLELGSLAEWTARVPWVRVRGTSGRGCRRRAWDARLQPGASFVPARAAGSGIAAPPRCLGAPPFHRL